MQFYEKKLKTRYKYYCEDIFGKMEITSKKRLVEEKDGGFDTGFLDDVFYAIWDAHRKDGNKKIKSKVKGYDISYTLEKLSPWESANK